MHEVDQEAAVTGVLETVHATEEAQAAAPAADDNAAPDEQSGETTPEPAAGDTETQPEGEQPKKKGGFQRRIDQLTKDKGEIEREREYWREQALRGTPKAEPKVETAKPVETAAGDAPKPKADDFETQAEYIDALMDWKDDKKARDADVERTQAAARTQQETAKRAFSDRETAFTAVHDDYAEVIQGAIADNVPCSPALWGEIQDHENGPALLYYLAQHPAEAGRLSALTPTQVAREVGRLEPRFVPQADAEAEDEPAAPVSKAPKPPTPVVRTSGNAPAKDPGEMDFEQYEVWRKKQFPGLR